MPRQFLPVEAVARFPVVPITSHELGAHGSPVLSLDAMASMATMRQAVRKHAPPAEAASTRGANCCKENSNARLHVVSIEFIVESECGHA